MLRPSGIRTSDDLPTNVFGDPPDGSGQAPSGTTRATFDDRPAHAYFGGAGATTQLLAHRDPQGQFARFYGEEYGRGNPHQGHLERHNVSRIGGVLFGKGMDAEIARDEISISPYLGDEMQYEMRLRSVLDRGGGSAKACGITSEDSASRAPVVRYRSAVDSALQEQLEQGKGGGHGQVG